MKYNYNTENSSLSIDLDEEIDMKACKILRNVIDGYIIKYQPKEFVMDLTNVKFMDSSGIGLILGRYNLIKLFDSSMVIVNPNENIKRIIELSNVNRYIKMRCD